jgi:hypothetical protein
VFELVRGVEAVAALGAERNLGVGVGGGGFDPAVVATKLIASRSQQSNAKATRTRSPFLGWIWSLRCEGT